jgi:hypothetical protein
MERRITEREAVALGRRYIAETRESLDHVARTGASSDKDSPATQRLWAAEDLDDESVWTAVMAAVDAAEEEDERWCLGDSICDMHIATRPVLRERWHKEFHRNPKVRAVFEAMWSELDAMPYGRGWWAEPRS